MAAQEYEAAKQVFDARRMDADIADMEIQMGRLSSARAFIEPALAIAAFAVGFATLALVVNVFKNVRD